MFWVSSYLSILLISLVGLVGCAPSGVEVISETDEKQYQLGQDFKTQGRLEEALGAFERVIDARRDSPESHLEVGYIYLSKYKDPINAIYHFKRYLRLQPHSSQATQVGQLIETAQKEFARQMVGNPYEDSLDRIDLMDLVQTLKQENVGLKRDLISAKSRVQQLEDVLGQARRSTQAQAYTQNGQPTQIRPSTPASRQPAPTPRNAPRTYVIKSGDTLSAISSRFYGTSSRWIDIYQANRDRLSSESAIRVGQEIRIP